MARILASIWIAGGVLGIFKNELFVALLFVSTPLKRFRSTPRTVSTSQAVRPFESWNDLHEQPVASRETSSLSFLSFVPAAHMRTRALEVIITNRDRFLIVFPPKKRENFLGASAGSSFPPTAWPAGCCVTNILPSFRIRSSLLVKTGDQSMSS